MAQRAAAEEAERLRWQEESQRERLREEEQAHRVAADETQRQKDGALRAALRAHYEKTESFAAEEAERLRQQEEAWRAAAEETERADFIKEVQLLSGLEDENISRVLGIGTMAVPHFVVMEYLEHGDLTQFLQSHLPEDTPFLVSGTKTLSFPSLIYMATQVASGMKYLESLNFVHRDLATR